MLFSCFSVKEVLVSSHVTTLSGRLVLRVHYSDVLHYGELCVPIDQDGANVLRLDVLLTDWLGCVQSGRCHYAKKNVF